MPVHPRGCGEYSCASLSSFGSVGSSPRMRGIPGLPCLLHFILRFIPADAGNTPIQCHRVERLIGSSPRMRGIRRPLAAGQVSPRFIPADAGNTFCLATGAALFAVHPRGCGEYVIGFWHLNGFFGSSPRMRGIHVPLLARPFHLRFIPADAGNTDLPLAANGAATVHPRGCGEYVFRGRHAGSSPRMRGILCPVNL